jgi:hypothetical protein
VQSIEPRNHVAFLESLVGSENEIDAIFEHEGELESALDTSDQDYPNTQPEPSHQQRLAPPHPQTSATRAVPPRRPSVNISHQPPFPSSPRARLHSAVARGLEVAHSYTSPLAQIFTPLVVSEEPSEGPPEAGTSTTGISYGPASRRRLTFSHRHPAADPVGATAPSGGSPRRRTTSGPRLTSMQDAPTSPLGPAGRQDLDTEGKTVSEVEQEEDTGGVPPGLSSRLASMEERQVRIEELLLKLVESRS